MGDKDSSSVLEIDKDTPLEKIIEISSGSCSCCKTTYCCEKTPVLLDGEFERIADFLGADVDAEILKEKAFWKKSEYGAERLSPKIYNFYCFFAVPRWRGMQNYRKELMNRIFVREKGLARLSRWINNVLEVTDTLRTDCSIYEVRPLECQIVHCNYPELTEQFTERFLLDKSNPESLKRFEAEKEMRFSANFFERYRS